MMNRRQLLIAWGAAPAGRALALTGAAGLGLAALGGCAGLGGPTVITLGETELLGLMNRAFPMQRRVLEVLDVQLSAPRLRLLPERNRMAVDLVLRTQERLLGAAALGQLAFDGALRYEPQEASVRLTQVRVQQLSFAGTQALPVGSAGTMGAVGPLGAQGSAAAATPSAPVPAYLQRLGAALAERALEDLAIYRVSAERQVSLRQLGLEPGAVTVTSRGVEITLARIKT